MQEGTPAPKKRGHYELDSVVQVKVQVQVQVKVQVQVYQVYLEADWSYCRACSHSGHGD